MCRKAIKLSLFCFCILATKVFSQGTNSLSIDSAFAMARRNYPLVKQKALVGKTQEYSISNASKGYLPQISLNGQATYQSAVTELPITIPNLSIPSLSKDQYKIYGEINQPITDLYAIKHQKELVKANMIVEEQKIEIELYKLKERINNIFFGILLLDAQIEQTELLKKDIQSGVDKTSAAIANGTSIKTNADILKAEFLKVNQRTIELKSTRKGYAEMLSLFVGQPIDENTSLQIPSLQAVSATINRPELKLYDFQNKTFDSQSKLINSKNIPHLNFFAQGGYGRPALNFLSNEFNFYYIGGLRLNWNLSNLYTFKKEKQLLTLNQNSLDIQRETFLFNTSISMKQQNNELEKYQALINSDKEIIVLREEIKNTYKSQLENGTVTSFEYLTSLNAEDQAKQNLLLRQIQLLMAQYNYQTMAGN